MTGEAQHWRFPVACPACLAIAGNPLRVSQNLPSVVEIFVRCEACASEWTLSSAASPLILKPKPDRRFAKRR